MKKDKVIKSGYCDILVDSTQSINCLTIKVNNIHQECGESIVNLDNRVAEDGGCGFDLRNHKN